MESLMPANLVWIESLAQKCPYLDGQAVFKARTLYAMLTGARSYNDLEICNNQGVYKGGLNWYEFENAGLGKIQTTSILDIRVHPNPTTGKVYFETVQGNLGDAEVQFFDMSGRTVLAIKSATSANQLNYDLNDLPSGLYIYQLKYSNGDIYTGKVIKE
ncbi:MAG: T9SS type A sorting domain-containing protein [Bacteroidota bacterium]|nr:MAG: T9SS type A sorting domain-containing protein [Bacteroidota bacterium]